MDGYDLTWVLLLQNRPSYKIQHNPRQKSMTVLFPPTLVNVEHVSNTRNTSHNEKQIH